MMRSFTIGQLLKTLAISASIWLVVAAACLMIGSTGAIGWPSAATLRLRIDIVALASLVGAALAASGVVYQAILQNPLADPYLLGVSSGASLAAYLWRFAGAWTLVAAWSPQALAFAGALAAVALVLGVAGFRSTLEPLTLLLVGVVVNALAGSIFLLVNALLRDLPGSGGMLQFLVGGLQTNLAAGQLRAAAVVIAAGWIVLAALGGQLNVALLSPSEAQSLGVRVVRLRWIGLIVASLMTASAVAVSGPIGFVGLICPHLARLAVGSDHRRLLPVATALGAALLCIADALSRKLAGAGQLQTLLPVGVLTSLLGGPFFLLLLARQRRGVR